MTNLNDTPDLGATDKDTTQTPTASPEATQSTAPATDTQTAADANNPSADSPAEDADKTLDPITLKITTLQLNGEPLSGLSTILQSDDKILLDAATDGDGKLPDIQLTPQIPLKIIVKRWDGSLKEICTTVVPCTDAQFTLVSPSFVVPVKTELAEGAPGATEQQIPHYASGDYGALKDSADVADKKTHPQQEGKATHHASTTKPAAKPNEHPAGQSTPSSAAAKKTKTKPKVVSVSTPTKPTQPNPPQKPAIGRDSEGKPLAVFTHKVKDWWNSWHMPTLHLWGGEHKTVSTPAASSSGNHPASNQSAPTSASPQPGNSTPTGTTQVVQAGSQVQHHQEMAEQLQSLFTFCDENIQYYYGESSSSVLAQMANGTFTQHHHPGEHNKHSDHSVSFCYKYVKVALVHCRIVAGEPTGEYATQAGPALIAKGFRDVTNELPDYRWAASGDVIVYYWSPKTWNQRKISHNNPNLPNYGHIEIRSDENYYSDYAPKKCYSNNFLSKPLPNGQYDNYLNYTNIRIYRKVYDILPTLRIKAFLKCIREFEVTSIDDTDRYKILNHPLPNSTSNRFYNFEKHPWDGVDHSQLSSSKKQSTAAGAYQITVGTWDNWCRYGTFDDLHDKFSPIVQDRIAVFILEQCLSLQHVRTGNIDAAINDNLKKQWASLPGASQNAGRKARDNVTPLNMDYFKKIFNQYLDEEKKLNGL